MKFCLKVNFRCNVAQRRAGFAGSGRGHGCKKGAEIPDTRPKWPQRHRKGTEKAADKTGHATKVAAKDTAKGTEKAADKTGHETKVVAKDTAKGTEKVAEKTGSGREDGRQGYWARAKEGRG